MAKANGTVIPTNPRYRIGGWIAMRMWFCSSGLAPEPSNGTGLIVVNGLAAVSIIPKKNTATTPITARAAAPMRSPSMTLRRTHMAYPASTRPQSTMLPSSAAQAAAMVKKSGVDRVWLSAT